MNLNEAILARHSVRRYLDKPIEEILVKQIQHVIEEENARFHLQFQFVRNEPMAFSGFIARSSHFENVKNYVCLVGSKSDDLEERVGYSGEKIVLLAQQLGLNTCWVGASYKKSKAGCVINKADNEKLVAVIAVGYGANQGVAHKTKRVQDVSQCDGAMPDWFVKGVEAALLAPNALNHPKYKFILRGDQVLAKPGFGFYTKLDLGIAKYHFEIGAGQEVHWVVDE